MKLLHPFFEFAICIAFYHFTSECRLCIEDDLPCFLTAHFDVLFLASHCVDCIVGRFDPPLIKLSLLYSVDDFVSVELPNTFVMLKLIGDVCFEADNVDDYISQFGR